MVFFIASDLDELPKDSFPEAELPGSESRGYGQGRSRTWHASTVCVTPGHRMLFIPQANPVPAHFSGENQ